MSFGDFLLSVLGGSAEGLAYSSDGKARVPNWLFWGIIALVLFILWYLFGDPVMNAIESRG